MRRAARSDANHTQITAALRAVNCHHWQINWPTDLLVCHRDGYLIAMEIKRDAKAKLKPSQAYIQSAVIRSAFARVETPEQALQAAGYLRLP